MLNFLYFPRYLIEVVQDWDYQRFDYFSILHALYPGKANDEEACLRGPYMIPVKPYALSTLCVYIYTYVFVSLPFVMVLPLKWRTEPGQE